MDKAVSSPSASVLKLCDCNPASTAHPTDMRVALPDGLGVETILVWDLGAIGHLVEGTAGDILVFLAGRAVPLWDWLSPLMTLFKIDPMLGTASAKLIDSEGRLFSAGDVVFADASILGFGQGDHEPDAPLYSHVREVDSCSCGLFATRRSLFQEMGGLDTSFGTWPYQVADYCFRAHAQGHRSLFQPESVAVVLDASLAYDRPDEQVSADQARFRDRWGRELKRHPARPFLLDRDLWFAPPVPGATGRTDPFMTPSPKRALICAPCLPEFDRESGSRRLFDLISFLQEDGWTVSFVAERNEGGDRYIQLLRQRGIATYLGFTPSMERMIEASAFSVAFLAFWNVAERLIPVLRQLSPSTSIIVDSIDLHFVRAARRVFHQVAVAPLPGGLESGFGSEIVRELNTYAAADAVLTVSEKEAALINDLTADANLAQVVPDAEAFPPSLVPAGERRGILFLANFRHAPNVDAIEYFCGKIAPRIGPDLLERHPLYVVGNEPTDAVRRWVRGVDHARLVGWVPSVIPYLHHARVSVDPAPLRRGDQAEATSGADGWHAERRDKRRCGRPRPYTRRACARRRRPGGLRRRCRAASDGLRACGDASPTGGESTSYALNDREYCPGAVTPGPRVGLRTTLQADRSRSFR